MSEPHPADDRPTDVAADGPDAAVRRIRDRADRTRSAELTTALRRLEAQGELTPAQRETVARLSRRLTAAIIGPPTAALETAEDPEVRRAVRRVFDPDS